jgi:hypothetical protein
VIFALLEVDGYEIKDEEQIRQRLLEVSGDAHYLWFVANGDCGRFNSDLNCRTLEDYTSKRFYVERNQSFFLSRVRLLRQKDGISLTSSKTPAISERMLLPAAAQAGMTVVPEVPNRLFFMIRREK